MGKRHFSAEWLDKNDSNNHLVHYWCERKDGFTATCKLCNKDINGAYMGFGAFKQHSEERTHGIYYTISGGKTNRKGEKVTTQELKQ